MRLRDGKITIRPIAGTRPRGATPEQDLALEKELRADPKERAEHLMLLDLGRNDVGRVAMLRRPGGTRPRRDRSRPNVRVTDSYFIERYSHVMHIVSNVEGDAPHGVDPVDVLMAALPAGTLSGAPKVRAMQIIDELETESAASSMPARSVISAATAASTPASCCAPPWSRTGRSTSRPAAVSSLTAIRTPNTKRPCKRPPRSATQPPRPGGLSKNILQPRRLDGSP